MGEKWMNYLKRQKRHQLNQKIEELEDMGLSAFSLRFGMRIELIELRNCPKLVD
jgi:hypothetical protein